jgi:hypothetical protein
MKVKVTARKYGGDDAASWAIFRSDASRPVVTGLYRSEVAYYKKQIQEMVDQEG